MMNMEDIELKLLAGMPIEIPDCGHIYMPKVREIIQLGESKYNEYLSLLLMDRLNLTEDLGEQFSNFDIVFSNCYNNHEFKTLFLDAVNFIFKKKALMCDVMSSSEAFFYFEDGVIDRHNFNSIQEIVRIGNCISKTVREEYNFANDQAKKFMDDVNSFRNSFAYKKKDEMTIHSMLNGMAWKAENINILNIFELTMYQFRLGFIALNVIGNYQYTQNCISSGTLDAEQIKKFDSLQWAKPVEKK
jgi:hypothetical protein